MATPADLPRVPRIAYYGWVVVAVCFVANFAAFSTSAVFVAFFLSPMSDEFGWGRSTLAWGITVRTIVGSIASIIMGPLVDKYGTRWLGVATCGLAGISIAALYWVQELWQVYLLFGLSGIAGFGVPAGSHLSVVPVSKWFITGRAKAIGISTSGTAMGVFFAIPIGAYMIEHLGWRAAWMASGLFMLLVVVPAYAIFMRREPEDFGLRPDGAAIPEPGAISLDDDPDWTVRQAIRTPVLWALITSQAAIQFALAGMLFHRVSFFEDQGLSKTFVAWGIAVDPFVVIFSILAVGFFGGRIGIQTLGFYGAAGWAISLLPMLFYLPGHGYFIFIHSFVWAVAAGASVTFTNLIWPTYFGRRSLGAIRGAILPVAVAAGALSAPTFGYLIDATSYEFAIAVSIALFLVGGTTYLLTRPPNSRVIASSATATHFPAPSAPPSS